MKRIMVRVGIAVAIVAALYLVAVNVALNLPATQAFFNSTQGGKIIVSWDRAWSWFPLRLQITNLKVNAQTWSQQFEVSAPSVSGAIDLPALLTRTIRFNDVRSADVSARFRPRPRPDKDDSAIRQFYPVIPGRDPDLEAEPVPTQSPGWLLVFDIDRIGGSNDVWLAANRMTLDGEAAALFSHQGRHGPLTVSDGLADLRLSSVSIAGQKVAETGSVAGTFGFQSFIPQENRGGKIFEHLILDADIDLPIDGLDFLNTFLDKAAGMTVGGRGQLKGHLAYRLGALTEGADISIEAENLRVDLLPYTVQGTGTVLAKVDAGSPGQITANLGFSTIKATHAGDDASLFEGTDIGIDVVRSAVIFPEELTEEVPRSVKFALPKVTVPDISVYQRFLPDEWKATLVGGSGSLEGTAMMSGSTLATDLTLSSDNASVRMTKDTFETALSFKLGAAGSSDDKAATVDVAGTYIELDDSRFTTQSGDSSTPWRTRFEISEGKVHFTLPENQDEKTGVVGFWSLFQKSELKSMLSNVDGHVEGDLSVSNLDWVTVLFKKPFTIDIGKSAVVNADLTVEKGRLTTDSSLSMAPTTFTLGILDYIVEGTGGFALAVTRADVNPDLSLTATLGGASLRLEEEKTAVVSEVTINVVAQAKGVTLKDGGDRQRVEMTIPTATITDMSTYNAYLPKGSPIKLLNGTGKLSARLLMIGQNSATGYMKLTTSRVDADIQGDRISGVINLDVSIPGGSAEERRFNISGSKLTLSDVRVTGRHATGGWSGDVAIGKGSVIWKRPATLDMSGTFRMKDAQPILAIFQANRKENKWLDKLLDLRNINGQFTLKTATDSIVVPYAFATSDTFDVGAKGIFGANGSQGVFYARTGKLAGVLAIDGSSKKFGLIEATRKFESYKPGGPLPGINEAARGPAHVDVSAPLKPPQPVTKPKKQPFSLFKRR